MLIKKFFVNGFLFSLAILSFCGCSHFRYVSVVNVPNKGNVVKTKFRYYYVGENIADFEAWINGDNPPLDDFYTCSLTDIYAKEGIPITIAQKRETIVDSYGMSETANLGFFLLYMGTLGLAPFFKGQTTERVYSIALAGFPPEESLQKEISICTKMDYAGSLSPLALLFFHGTPKVKGMQNGKMFKLYHYGNGVETTHGQALAYGVAVCLKEWEDAGMITEKQAEMAKQFHFRHMTTRKARRQLALKTANSSNQAQRNTRAAQSIQPSQPIYSIEKLERVDGNDFEYQFVVKLAGECTLGTFAQIQQDFIVFVRNAYLQKHPLENAGQLVVDVRPTLDKGLIRGRAAVLTIAPEALVYDATLRRGRITVRFNPSQAAVAREWIRQNIETLVRDKNIALITGQLPPAATYHSLGERIKDDVVEIDFQAD